jgi:3-hydroxy acid dehydrogenase/malonic semialdehyde reductase
MVQTAFFQDLSFQPGAENTEPLLPADITEAVCMILRARTGAVFDEINVSPHKRHICFKKLEPK